MHPVLVRAQGPTLAGVVDQATGRRSFFGDTVNVAARMEASGIPSRIHVRPLGAPSTGDRSPPASPSGPAAARPCVKLPCCGPPPQVSEDFMRVALREGVAAERFVARGAQQIKGKGLMETHLVKAARARASPSGPVLLLLSGASSGAPAIIDSPAPATTATVVVKSSGPPGLLPCRRAAHPMKRRKRSSSSSRRHRRVRACDCQRLVCCRRPRWDLLSSGSGGPLREQAILISSSTHTTGGPTTR